MSQIDLSLISMEELLNEMERRCSEFICAYVPVDFQAKGECKYQYGKGSWHRSCSLSNVLNNDVLNNWNGELQKLQRINDEETY